MPRFAKLENTNILRQEITFLLSDHILLTMLYQNIDVNRNIPVSASVVGIDVNDTDAISTVFPDQAVWVWAVRDVLCHKRHGDHHFLDIINGALDLKQVKR